MVASAAGLPPKDSRLFYFPVGKQIRGNYSLAPIAFVVALGCFLPAFQIVRTLYKSPDVQINKNGNPRPYEKLETPDGKPIQYKYFSTKDYAKEFKSERPRLD